MDAGNKSMVSSFKSKKPLHSPASSVQSKQKVSKPSPDSLSVKTPGKQMGHPRRLSNRGAALSIKEIRQAASRRRERRPDPTEKSDPDLKSEEDLSTKRKKYVASETKLPEKYELLDKFFNSLDCSIRLLQLKRCSPTFSYISSQIETLTDRRFTYNHLAQLKFLMPEAIVFEKVLQLDERTSCMKPALRITMNVEAIETKENFHTGNLVLRKIFRSRLLDFFKSHPEGDEVPEEELPEPFERLKENVNLIPAQPSGTTSVMDDNRSGISPSGSHLPPTFKRSFSNRASCSQLDKSMQDRTVVSRLSVCAEDESSASPSGKEICKIAGDSDPKLNHKQASEPSFVMLETPVKCVDIKDDNGYSGILKTPVEMASTPAKLMSATPMLQPPKRSQMSPDDNSLRSPSKLVRRPPPNRPLKFDSPVKILKADEEYSPGRKSSIHDDILSGALLQSIQEKERSAAMEQNPAITQARWRKQMVAGLPKLFDTIYYFFHSIRSSVVTKEELVHKLVNQLNILGTREVEEQLRLLQELAPEWIYEKTSLSGDLLMCVNKISSPEAIRTRLSEAI